MDKKRIKMLVLNLTQEPIRSCLVSPTDTALRMAGGVLSMTQLRKFEFPTIQ